MITFSPTAKIFLYIVLIVTVFLSNSFGVYLALLILVSFFALRVPLSNLKRGLIPIALFLAFTFFSNILFQKGRVVYEILGLTVTDEGIRNGTRLTLRLFILIIGAKILTATTTADDLIVAITSILGPIGRWKPVKEFVSTMSLTISFLPIIFDEAQIFYRQTFRNSKDATFLDKIKLSVSLLTPLFESSIKRAKNLSSKDM